VSGSTGLEGGSWDRLEDGLAPLDAEGRHDGGSEGALRGSGQSVAHEGGAEGGGHGEYGWCERRVERVVVVVVSSCFTEQCRVHARGDRADEDGRSLEDSRGAAQF
jgi:hypothetical protein